MAKEDCFAYVNKNKCLALRKLDCDGCSFYQTVSQLKKAREKAKAENMPKSNIESAIAKAMNKNLNNLWRCFYDNKRIFITGLSPRPKD